MLQTQTGSGTGGAVVRERALGACDEALIADWRALAAVASEPCAFAEDWFMLPAITHLGPIGVTLLEVRALSGELLGMIALERHRQYGRIPVRHVRNWVHFQCFMGTPLVRSGREQTFWAAVLGWLDNSDWPDAFLTLRDMDAAGPVVRALGDVRRFAIVHQYKRAFLHSSKTADAYLEAFVRPKKRKELRRLAARLHDLGSVTFDTYDDQQSIETWCEDFLKLEQAGWKGRDGAALGNTEATRLFLHAVLASASPRGRLDLQRLSLDGRPIAMLINFRTPPGSWSFKIAYDETLARFSPGVMIELANLRRVLDDPEIDWMDSCAVADHPMIDRLWAERREISQITVPLSGLRRKTVHAACRAIENASAMVRSLRS